MTLIGKIDEYILQLENAVTQLRQENEQLKQALQQKSAPTMNSYNTQNRSMMRTSSHANLICSQKDNILANVRGAATYSTDIACGTTRCLTC